MNILVRENHDVRSLKITFVYSMPMQELGFFSVYDTSTRAIEQNCILILHIIIDI